MKVCKLTLESRLRAAQLHLALEDKEISSIT